MNKYSLCNFLIVLTLLSIIIIGDVKVLTAAEPVGAAAGASVLPAVKDFETSEVCSLKTGSGSEEISLGETKGPKFLSCGPSSFALDKNERLYIVDAMNFKVLLIDKGKVVKVLRYPEGETQKHKFYISDIAVSNDGKTLYLLNQTLKSLFVMNENGKIKNEIKFSKQTVRPSKIYIAENGNVVIRDGGGIKTLVYSPAGKLLGSLAGGEISNIVNRDGFLYVLGEFDKDGRDILLMDPLHDRKSKVFARLTKVIKETKPYDYQIIGTDAKQNLYASIVEKIREDVIQTMLYKFGKDGKVMSRTKILPFKQLWNTSPTRHFAVSPAGNVYAFASDDKFERLLIYKVTSK